MKYIGRISLLVAGLVAASIASVQPAKAQWTGCGLGGYGSYLNADLAPSGSPISIGSTGQTAGVFVNCDYAMGVVVAGVGGSYGWGFGDLEKLGLLKNEIDIWGRAGVVITPGALAYAKIGWTQVDTTWLGKIDGYKYGVGVEIKQRNTPISWAFEYNHAVYDVKDIVGPSADATGDSFTLRASLKLGPGMFGGSGPVFSNEDQPSVGCDPKIDRNCKVR